MYTGWMREFPEGGFLSPQENASRFSPKVEQDVAPDERASLVHFNSTYVDLIDRRFRLRGMVSTTMVLLGTIGLFLLGFFLLFTLVIPNLEGDFWDWVMYAMVAVCVVGAPVLFWHTTLKYEFFTYVWYPTRFNRRNRMVYFFTGGKEGAVRVPWDDAVFYISRDPPRTSCATCAAASLKTGWSSAPSPSGTTSMTSRRSRESGSSSGATWRMGRRPWSTASTTGR